MKDGGAEDADDVRPQPYITNYLKEKEETPGCLMPEAGPVPKGAFAF